MKTKKIMCYECKKITDCYLEEKEVEEKVKQYNIKYLSKNYICKECGNEVFDEEMFDYNVHIANDEIRKQSGLIRTCEIEEIIEKYGISQKILSNMLGFGEIQISRYLKSGNPNKEHSDILKLIKDNPFLFEGYLLNYKDKIPEKTYKKILGKVKQLQLVNEHSKLYNVGIYLIEQNEDVTNLALQKTLYFISGFSSKFLGHKIFNESVEAWVHGPVYRDLYDAFSYYVKNPIIKTEILKDKEFDISSNEKEYIDNISKYFICYSGNKLRNMSHLTTPWIKARINLEEKEQSNKIIDEKDIDEYFNKVVEEYHINTYEDIKRYSDYLFNKTFE